LISGSAVRAIYAYRSHRTYQEANALAPLALWTRAAGGGDFEGGESSVGCTVLALGGSTTVDEYRVLEVSELILVEGTT
jgi:hypothetical protein